MIVNSAWTLEALQRVSDELFRSGFCVLSLEASYETRKALILQEDDEARKAGFCKGCAHVLNQVRMTATRDLEDDQIRLHTDRGGVFQVRRPEVRYWEVPK